MWKKRVSFTLLYLWSILLDITYPNIFIEPDKTQTNRKGSDIWYMLEQRIGTLDINKVLECNRLLKESLQTSERKKIYYDKVMELENGFAYKGEW